MVLVGQRRLDEALSEASGELGELFAAQVLAAEENDPVLQDSLPDFIDKVLWKVRGQIDSRDFRAQFCDLLEFHDL